MYYTNLVVFQVPAKATILRKMVNYADTVEALKNSRETYMRDVELQTLSRAHNTVVSSIFFGWGQKYLWPSSQRMWTLSF